MTVVSGTVPVATAVSKPELAPMVATVVTELLQVPPVPDDKVVVAPWQSVVTPLIAGGAGFTVTVVVAAQLVGSV